MESRLTTGVIENRKEFRYRIKKVKTYQEKPPKHRPTFVIIEEHRKVKKQNDEKVLLTDVDLENLGSMWYTNV